MDTKGLKVKSQYLGPSATQNLFKFAKKYDNVKIVLSDFRRLFG